MSYVSTILPGYINVLKCKTGSLTHRLYHSEKEAPHTVVYDIMFFGRIHHSVAFFSPYDIIQFPNRSIFAGSFETIAEATKAAAPYS